MITTNSTANRSGMLEALAREAHVWFANPDTVTDPDVLRHYLGLLSPDEAERYRRFHLAADRTRYLVSHALVRTVLSGYLDVEPATWRFVPGEHGRPEIGYPQDLPCVRFNLTHTAGLCACIVTLDLDCGIDAENLSRDHDLQRIANRMLAARELEALREPDDIEFRKGFFNYWTLREAYGKALGTGIGGLSHDFHFEIGEKNQVQIHYPDTSPVSAADWQFSLLNPDSDHIAAAALYRPGLPDRTIITRFLTPG